MRLIKDPTDGKPVITKIPKRLIHRSDGTTDAQEAIPRGYQAHEIMPGVRVAVHEGYLPLIRALTMPAQISESAAIGTLQDIAAIEKHIGLALDTFHASRTMQAELSLTGKISVGGHQKRGLSLLEYAPQDLNLAAQKGLITQEMADWVRRSTPYQVGGKTVKLSPHAITMLGLKNGLNAARIADVMYRYWLREVPITGAVNKWVFDKMTRSAIAQSFLMEFERAAAGNPHLNATQVSRMVSRDINAMFGNLQKESLFKNPSLSAVTQILFLVPRWVEALATREARAAKQFGQVGVQLATGKPVYFGTAARGVGAGLGAYLLATQILNYYFRGHRTLSNPEAGHKLDAWIPDITGKGGKGFFISPLSVFGEITHDLIRFYETKPDMATAVNQILQNKLGNMGRFFQVLAGGRDPMTNEKLIGSANRAIKAGIQLVPVPIFASQGLRAIGSELLPGLVSPPAQGAVQRQISASAGFKTEPAPTAQLEVYRMADNWKRASKESNLRTQVERRLKEDFGPSEYRDLRSALARDDMKDAARAFDALLESGKAPQVIRRTMAHPHPFTGSSNAERRFFSELTPEQQKTYEAAIAERHQMYRKFEQMLREKYQRKE